MSKLKSWVAPVYKLGLPIPSDQDENDSDVQEAHRLTLNGLSLNDITTLVNIHQAPLTMLFGLLVGENGKPKDVALDDIRSLATAMLQTAPEVAADVIAFSAHERDAGPMARNLPFPVQIEALEQAAVLTFKVQGGLKKVIEIVTRILSSVSPLLAEASSKKAETLSRLVRSSGDSVAK